MKRARGGYKHRDNGSLKKAQADLVAAAGGGVSRLSAASLSDATDPDNAKRHLPIDVVIDLEKHAGDPIVTRYALLQQGFIPVPLHNSDAMPYPLALASFTTKAGETLAAGGMALQDGKVNVAEAKFLKQRALEAARPLASLIADCDRVIAAAGDRT